MFNLIHLSWYYSNNVALQQKQLYKTFNIVLRALESVKVSHRPG